MRIKAPGGSWDFIILALSAYVVFEIIFELIYGSDNELYSFLQIGDTIACVFFFIDVMWRWCASQNKLGFWKWGWIDLIASIPTLDGLRWARMFRVFRIFRIVRGMRSAERVIEYFFKDRAKSTAAVALTILFGSVLIGSTPKSVDFNERRRIGQGPSIDNFQSFYSRRLGVVLASSCGGSLL